MFLCIVSTCFERWFDKKILKLILARVVCARCIDRFPCLAAAKKKVGSKGGGGWEGGGLKVSSFDDA